jgi:integral membrane sensor domain MASE1
MTASRRVVMLVFEVLVAFCALVALITPVVLWSAWSLPVFMAILAAGCAAVLLAYLLILSAPDDFL